MTFKILKDSFHIPSDWVEVSVGQGLQRVSWGWSWYLPLGQNWHWLRVELRYDPIWQIGNEQSPTLVAPAIEVVKPSGQRSQAKWRPKKRGINKIMSYSKELTEIS